MATEVPVIQVKDVSKRFVIRKEKSLKERIVNLRRSNEHREDFWAVRDVSLEINAGSTVGLIGPNGSGKSTLLKLVGGIIQPTMGSIERRGRLAALLELGAGFHPDLTGRENVYLNSAILGLSKEQTDRHFDAIVDFSGIERFIDTQVKFYSSGMYVRLAFAVAIHVDPDVLLVDEVLAVGDEPFQRKCMDRIRQFQHEGRTIVLVTHALDQVAELCDRAVVLEHGNIVVDGHPREALRQLRSDFEVIRQEDREREREHAVREDVEISQGPVGKIHSVSLQTLAGGTLTDLEPGGGVVVEIEVETTREITDSIMGVAIETSLGQLVYGTNTKLLGMSLPPLNGKQRVRVSLPRVWLGEGLYQVQAAIADTSGVELDRMVGSSGFQVRSDGRSIGPLHLLSPDFQIDGLSAVSGDESAAP